MDKIEMLLQDEAFLDKMQDATSIEDLVKLFAENGVEITAEEVRDLAVQARSYAHGADELDADALDSVAGGFSLRIPNIGKIFDKLGKKLGSGLFNYWDNLINSNLN